MNIKAISPKVRYIDHPQSQNALREHDHQRVFSPQPQPKKVSMMMVMKRSSICKNLTNTKAKQKQSMAIIRNRPSIAEIPETRPKVGFEGRKLSVFNEDSENQSRASV
jgi:hypothetical protein